MKFTRSTAIRLTDDLVLSLRTAIYEYQKIVAIPLTQRGKWKDSKTREFLHSLEDMNKCIRKTFAEVNNYAKHLRKRINEL